MKPASKTYVNNPKLEQEAAQCIPTAGGEYALYNYIGTNLYQWWKRTGVTWEPYGKVMELQEDDRNND